MADIDADIVEVADDERALIGLAIALPGAIEAALEECNAQDFVFEIHQHIFELYESYAGEGKRPTMEEVAEALGDGKRNIAEGLTLGQYLAKMAAEAPLIDGVTNARNLGRAIRLRAELERGEKPAPDPEPEPYKAKFAPMFWSDRASVKERYEWTIKGIAPARKTLLIIGPPGSGKSFGALDMAAHVAIGRDYRGRRVKQSGVGYLYYESPEGAPQRIEAYVRERGITGDVPMVVLRRPPQLFAVAENAKALSEELLMLAKRWSFGLGVIVIDTHNASTRGSSEIRSEDVSKIIQTHEDIRAATGAALWIVGHTNEEGRHRGNQQLYNGVDAAILFEKLEGKGDDEFMRDDDDRIVHRATVIKMREGKDHFHWDFTLKEIELWKDEDGDPVTSMVVAEPTSQRKEESGRSAATARAAGAFWLKSDGEIQFFKAMLEAVRLHGISAAKATTAGPNVGMVARYADVVKCYGDQEPQSPRESDDVYWRRVNARVRGAGKLLKSFGVISTETIEVEEDVSADATLAVKKRIFVLWPTGRRVEGRAYLWPPAPKRVEAPEDIIDATPKAGSAF